MEFKQLNKSWNLPDIISQLNKMFSYLSREFNELNNTSREEKVVQQKPKRYANESGDKKVSFSSLLIKLGKVLTLSNVENNSLFVDDSDKVLKFKDDSGSIIPLAGGSVSNLDGGDASSF